MQEKLNEQVRAIPPYPSIRPLSRGIVTCFNSCTRQQPTLKLCTFTAEQFEGFLQVSPFCLFGLISTKDFECWMAHLQADHMLLARSFCQTTLNSVQMQVDLWQYKFRCSFDPYALLITSADHEFTSSDSEHEVSTLLYNIIY